MKNQRYKVTCDTIQVRIDVNWDEADVDAVFSEVSRMFPSSHKIQGNQTPTSESVDVLQDALFEEFKSDPYNKNETNWQQKGITYDQGSSLMMGNSFVYFNVDLNKTKAETLPEVVKDLRKVVSKFVSKYVRYYKDETKIGRSTGFVIV